ncbi:hypothetical protein MMC14_009419 [Varicellaria rhodocarpa]|nr:hypothetical protein [Varicellaria rhodocarpa]
MSGYRAGKPSWVDPGFYPVEEKLGKGIKKAKGEVLIVNIPRLEQIFEKAAHDFFTPQPIKGARAYHLYSVLHDWDDTSSINILKNIVSAIERGYSKLLINELVVPEQGASWSITSVDWLMLALGAVKERTEQDWHRLIEAAGLKITDIGTKEQGTESLIECELA